MPLAETRFIDIVSFTDYFDDESKLDIEAKINSLEELKNFCNEKKLQIFNENYKPDINDSLTVNLRKYDDKFFEKRSLLIILRFKETYDNYSFDSLNIQDDTISINLVSANGNSLYKIKSIVTSISHYKYKRLLLKKFAVVFI